MFKRLNEYIKKKEKSITIQAYYFLITVLIFSVSLFFIGLHNLDLGQNFKYINAEYGLELLDINNKYGISEPSNIYITGMNQAIFAFMLGLITLFSLGSISAMFISKYRGK